MAEIERAQAERNRFLDRLHELSGANPLQPVEEHRIAVDRDIPPESVEGIVQILKHDGFLERSTFGHVTITPAGIKEVERRAKMR